MNNIIIFTDCVGIKQSSIKGVFDTNFNHRRCEIKLLPDIEKSDFKTPLQYEDFYKIIGHRMQFLLNSSRGIPMYLASIQRGYYEMGLLWHLAAIVSIRSPEGKQVEAFASTTPVEQKVSDRKRKDPSKNFKDLLAEEFPKWNKKKDPVYTLLTGEDEKGWLQQPLRHCMKYLLR